MKKGILILVAVLMTSPFLFTAEAANKVYPGNLYNYNYGENFIFEEQGVTFSVYPDGEFDFFIGNYARVGVGVRVGGVGVTFNSGFDYNPYVQYDDYGAVIQVENIPVFYDFYGRVNQIGNVDIWYRNGLVSRIGGLRVFLPRWSFYSLYGIH